MSKFAGTLISMTDVLNKLLSMLNSIWYVDGSQTSSFDTGANEISVTFPLVIVKDGVIEPLAIMVLIVESLATVIQKASIALISVVETTLANLIVPS